MEIIYKAVSLVSIFMENFQICRSHGVDHFINVLIHAQKAVEEEKNLSESNKTAICLAALLHDVDDPKFFPYNDDKNAKLIMKELNLDDDMQKLVLEMISLVSASKNKNSTVPKGEEWKLIPRYADRLEAIGKVGMARCFQYASTIQLILYKDETPSPTDEKELEEVIKGRFDSYNGKSKTMIDHYYDKLLHINVPVDFPNIYLTTESKYREYQMVSFIMDFSKLKNDGATREDIFGFIVKSCS